MMVKVSQRYWCFVGLKRFSFDILVVIKEGGTRVDLSFVSFL